MKYILKAINNRLSVGGIFCDLKKAFDCVNHEILVDKFQFYGMRGKILAFIQSYLRGRYQKVLIAKFNAYDDVSSGWEKKLQKEFLGVRSWAHCFFSFI
jgi:hypothetical protein